MDFLLERIEVPSYISYFLVWGNENEQQIEALVEDTVFT